MAVQPTVATVPVRPRLTARPRRPAETPPASSPLPQPVPPQSVGSVRTGKGAMSGRAFGEGTAVVGRLK